MMTDPQFLCINCGGPREIESVANGVTKRRSCFCCMTMRTMVQRGQIPMTLFNSGA